MMFDPETVKRYNAAMGGCGDPECCGSYATMEAENDGEYVQFSDYDQLIVLYREAQREIAEWKHEARAD